MQSTYRRIPRAVLTIALLAAFSAACSDTLYPDPASPADAAFAKGGNKGGGGGSGDETSKGGTVVAGDLSLDTDDAPALESICPTPHGFSNNGWGFVYRKSGCLLPPTLWVSTTYAEYKVADDVIIHVRIEKGKNGRITHVRLTGQDVDGAEGIFHDTDWLPVAEPVTPTTAGFTLHVHARNVALWRWNSHLARGGQRVEIVGYLSIGDMIYPPQ